MYSKAFYITEKLGNNAFSWEKRTHKKLFVPSLKKIESFEEIELGTEVCFEDYDFDDVLQSCSGLKNFYEFQYTPLQLSPVRGESSTGSADSQGKRKIPLYLFDNHNHAYYFWYLARSQGIIADNSLLYHIDEHADTRDTGAYLLKPDSQDMKVVFEYTNFVLNVGNYIIPAEQEGLVGETIQIRSQYALEEYQRGEYLEKEKEKSIILNLDLDFFEPALDFIDFELKKQVILDIASKADLITVCTSPFFIEQERAREYFKEIFNI